MVELTPNAEQELKAYFEGKTVSPIRVYLAPGGCSGPRLALALDDPSDDDDVHPHDGFTFVVSKELGKNMTWCKIDVTHMGFTVDSDLPLPQGGGSCCSSGSSCGSNGSSGSCCC